MTIADQNKKQKRILIYAEKFYRVEIF